MLILQPWQIYTTGSFELLNNFVLCYTLQVSASLVFEFVALADMTFPEKDQHMRIILYSSVQDGI